MAAAEDINVDELRRRARRRLVGAIVLALLVAVFVPMLLESEPKPLGEDVSVKIPPIDEGKFVNRLGDKGKGDAAKAPAPKSEAKAEAPKPEPAKVATAAPAATEAPKTDVPAPDPSKAEAPNPDALKMDAPKMEAPKAEAPKAEAPKEEPAKAAATANVAKATPPQAPAPTPAPMPTREVTAGDFSVQVFAFSDDKGANSLVNKLKAKGFPAYTEPVSTSRGTLWRVRVGPYTSRESAVNARERLKGEGYNGIVAAAK
jgi:DedD protein